MFVDEVEIEIEAGDGGSGSTSFRREKYVPNGGPNGGDGGHGGDVIFCVNTNTNTLLDFRFRHAYQADNGNDGASNNKYGRDGKDLILKIPQGTVVTDLDTGQVLADLSAENAVTIIARGGIGGRGNSHFATAIHQTPKFAEKGEPGERFRVKLELKLLADVGLLGYPNVGKSTLISAVSAAKPKIADYPFTTLVPNLGVVYVEPERNFVMADIPGLIEGAHEGVGLGHQFLRHVERTRILIHLLDVSGLSGRDPLQDFEILNRELSLYSETLANLPQIIALNKIDVLSDTEDLETLEKELKSRGYMVYRTSSATRKGLKPLIYEVMERLEKIREEEIKAQPVTDLSVLITAAREGDERKWEAAQVDENIFEVTGRGVERLVVMTDLNNTHSVTRMQKILERMGVYRKLKAIGIKHNDTVRIRKIEFDYADDDVYDVERITAKTRRANRGGDVFEEEED
ncbi:MAG: GTPase ObgE [Armatimonadetes bacterium]|nr:GTPase ObgE [Armatimonadota bacterium]